MATKSKQRRRSHVTRGRGWGIDSPSGRKSSALNAMQHGLTAMAVLVPGESQQAFDAHLAGYIRQFKPDESVEHDLVYTMAVARWRLRRIPVIESNMVVNEITYGSKDYDDIANDNQRVAYAFDRCNRALSLLTRYEGALNRTFDRAWKQLQELQKARLAAPAEKLRNESGTAPHPPVKSGRRAPSSPSPEPQTQLSGPHKPDRRPNSAYFRRRTPSEWVL